MEQKNTQGGVFLVLESADESYKDQVFEALKDKLTQEKYNVLALKFPCLNKSSGYFVAQYINGNYDQLRDVSPYAASLFFALDRYEMTSQIQKTIENGGVVLATGFSGSTISKLGRNFLKPEERRGYFIWNDSMEHEILGTPRPDKSFVLNTVQNEAESSPSPQKTQLTPSVSQVYQDVCSLFTKDFQLLDCIRDGRNLQIVEARDILWRMIQPIVPNITSKGQSVRLKSAVPTKVNHDEKYFVPTNFDKNILDKYTGAMTRIIAIGSRLISELNDYLSISMGSTAQLSSKELFLLEDRVQNAVKSAIPMSVVFSKGFDEVKVKNPKNRTEKLAKQFLEDVHSNNDDAAKLVSVWPRNELDVVPEILYEHSGLSLSEIKIQVADWSYDKKAALLSAALEESIRGQSTDQVIIKKIRYEWDIICSGAVFIELSSLMNNEGIHRQELTPRFGYEMPSLIEEAGLTDEFEECFDISLRLYSELQAAGYEYEAQYATLLGHKLRLQLTHDASQLISFLGSKRDQTQTTENLQLLRRIQEKVAEIHPILGEMLQLSNAGINSMQPDS